MKNILITGTCLSRNNGQMAMVISFVENFKKLYKNEQCNFTIFSLEPEYDKKRYKTYNIKVLPDVLFYYGKKRMIIFYMLTIINAIFYKLFKKSILTDNFTIEVLKSDIVVNLSGDCITYDYHKYPCIVHLLQLYIPTKFYKKFSYICAQSIGYFDKSIYSKIVLRLLNGINLITCREKRTFNYLKRDLELKNNVYLTSDLAYLVKKQKPCLNNSQKIELHQFQEFISSGYVISISLSSLIGEYSKEKNKIGLFYKELIENVLHTDSNIKIALIPHVYQKGHNDIEVCKELKSMINKEDIDRIFILQNQYLPNEIKFFISLCNVMIGFRMHPTIQAISMNIPAISVAYSHKTEGLILDNYGEKFYCDIRDKELTEVNDIIIEKLKYIIENRVYCSNCIKEKNTQILEYSKMNFSLFKEMYK